MANQRKIKFSKEMIAPCGANCEICLGHLSPDRKKPCSGCLAANKTCAFIKKQCDLLMDQKIRFCFKCAEFPCRNLMVLDKRYRARYEYSFIENLKAIEKSGIRKFLRDQERKFRCKKCGGVVCVHDRICYGCGAEASTAAKII